MRPASAGRIQIRENKMKKYLVVIKFKNINRTNQLIKWANNEEEAKKLALRDWGNPTYEKLEAIKQ